MQYTLPLENSIWWLVCIHNDWLDIVRTLTSIILIGLNIYMSVRKNGYGMSEACLCNRCVCHRVSHIFLFFQGWSDSVFLFNVILTPSCFPGQFSLLFFQASLIMVWSSKCFFVQWFCGCVNNHFCRKYWLYFTNTFNEAFWKNLPIDTAQK